MDHDWAAQQAERLFDLLFDKLPTFHWGTSSARCVILFEFSTWERWSMLICKSTDMFINANYLLFIYYIYYLLIMEHILQIFFSSRDAIVLKWTFKITQCVNRWLRFCRSCYSSCNAFVHTFVVLKGLCVCEAIFGALCVWIFIVWDVLLNKYRLFD